MFSISLFLNIFISFNAFKQFLPVLSPPHVGSSQIQDEAYSVGSVERAANTKILLEINLSASFSQIKNDKKKLNEC